MVTKPLAFAIFTLFVSTGSAVEYNVVELDNATFPLVVGHSLPVFLCFDKEYAYGDKADAFKGIAKVSAKSGSEILIGKIGISTFGDKENQDMARRFGFIPKDKETLESEDMDKLFPKFMYFKPGNIEGQLYNGAVTKSAMLKFLGVEEKTCDLLTGAFCSDEEKLHMEYFTGKPMEDLKNELKVLSKKSGETLKKDERTLVDGRLKVLKKLIKALKKSNAK